MKIKHYKSPLTHREAVAKIYEVCKGKYSIKTIENYLKVYFQEMKEATKETEDIEVKGLGRIKKLKKRGPKSCKK